MGDSIVGACAITTVSWFTSFLAIYLGIDLLNGISTSCSGFQFLGAIILLIGTLLIFLPVLSCTAAFADQNLVGEAGLACSAFCYVTSFIVLLALAIFALVVSSKGGGKSIPGRSYKEYYVESYSKWMQHKVNDAHNWETYYKSAVEMDYVCYDFGTVYRFDSLDAFHKRKLTPFESGCCKPPEDCNFNYTAPAYWVKPEDGNYTNVDCNRWDNNPHTLCFDCESCKGAFLQDVTSRYFKTGIVWMVILPIIVFVGGLIIYCGASASSSGGDTDHLLN